MKRLLKAFVAAAFILLQVMAFFPITGEAQEPAFPKEGTKLLCKSFYHNSLHATGEGMRRWYEEDNGFMNITDIPYAKLDCKNCHADSCDRCHTERNGGKKVFSLQKARNSEMCLECHARQKVTMKVDKALGIEDVHATAGLECTDCHGAKDVHGDGAKYGSMRDPGAVEAACINCHADVAKANPSHKRHIKNIDCAACHVSNTITCYNCHFDSFMATGKRPGNFIPGKDWLLLVNHEGKVTSGNAQTLVYKGKKFIAYVPYFTHSIMKKARQCDDCHGAEASKLLNEGGHVPVVKWEDGKLKPFKGVIPWIEGKLDWVYLDKKESKWVPMPNMSPDLTQRAGHATPLTEKQLRRLKSPQEKKD